ncbi:MAG: hypothetical protein JOZ40_21095 [Methylobacteriaceae bacterium]|nr:hypothetical protein [Methylobacteriaceae bacterium]
MITPADRQPIVVADAGPLIRLAAAGLLNSLRGLNRRIVLVDRVEDEVIGDLTKPFAAEISKWIDDMGSAILRVDTVFGVGVAALRERSRTPQEDRLLKTALRDSGEHALREFVAHWQPTDSSSAVVLYEDRKVASLFLDAEFPLTLMTTRAFAQVIANWGINVDAVAALEAIAGRYDLKPALVGEIDPSVPTDQRQLPQPMKS